MAPHPAGFGMLEKTPKETVVYRYLPPQIPQAALESNVTITKPHPMKKTSLKRSRAELYKNDQHVENDEFKWIDGIIKKLKRMKRNKLKFTNFEKEQLVTIEDDLEVMICNKFDRRKPKFKIITPVEDKCHCGKDENEEKHGEK